MIKKCLICCSALLMFMLSAQNCYATIYCDNSGNCSGTNENGESVRLYNNGLGNISGSIGDDRVNLYANGLGNISGSIGDNRVSLYNNGHGNISGSIGDDRVNLYDNGLGNTSGSVGDERVSIYNDDFNINNSY